MTYNAFLLMARRAALATSSELKVVSAIAFSKIERQLSFIYSVLPRKLLLKNEGQTTVTRTR